jgi:hypothetical protein
VDKLPGVPSDAYIARILPSRHDAGAVYVAVENHQNGDFAPYLLRSADSGRTWKSIAGDLPARGSVYAIAEDHVDPNLLFAGTEFAAYVSRDGGGHWLKISGLPTIAVRDLAIQRRANDLVIGTFGRGVYILDDYAPLRAPAGTATAAATLYPTRDAVLYVPTLQYGMPGKGFQGEMFYTAENPPFGAVFTYRLADGVKTLKEQRVEAEQAAAKAGKPIRYPTADELRAEEDEEPPAMLFTVKNADGVPVRVIAGPVTKGVHRVAWDLRAPAHRLPPNRPRSELDELFGDPLVGPSVMPGPYTVTMAQRVRGVVTQLGGPVAFTVVLDPQAAAVASEQSARWQFQEKLQALRRDIAGALDLAESTGTRLTAIRKALDLTPAAAPALHDRVRALQRTLEGIQVELRGDRRLGARSVPLPVAISERANTISGELNDTLAGPTATHQQQYQIALELFTVQRETLRRLLETDLPPVEQELVRLGAPYTPGRIPRD